LTVLRYCTLVSRGTVGGDGSKYGAGCDCAVFSQPTDQSGKAASTKPSARFMAGNIAKGLVMSENDFWKNR